MVILYTFVMRSLNSICVPIKDGIIIIIINVSGYYIESQCLKSSLCGAVGLRIRLLTERFMARVHPGANIH